MAQCGTWQQFEQKLRDNRRFKTHKKEAMLEDDIWPCWRRVLFLPL